MADKSMSAFQSIDDYINGFPTEVRDILEHLRSTIHRMAPDAQEKISYAMPTFTLKGNLVHFAAYKNHIGFYPGPSAIKKFSDELTAYQTSKGAIRFPLDSPFPFKLIEQIVQFRVNENIKALEAKKKK